MTRSYFIASLLLWGMTAGTSTLMSQEEKSIKEMWITDDRLATSESVMYYAPENCLFVSCINGNPMEKDGNGYIARCSMEGRITQLKWIEGLNAPKGLGSFGDILYVTDIDRIVEISIPNARINAEYPVHGAQFLNDIAVDPLGQVFITDMGTGKVHLLAGGTITEMITGQSWENPNGLCWHQNMLLIGTRDAIYSARPESGSLEGIFHGNTSPVDGLVNDGTGGIFFSDWSGSVFHLDADGRTELVVDLTTRQMNAADIEFSPENRMLFIPTFKDNRVICFQIP
ncbi:MAG: hypothetical protein JW861_04995 [Bacteroidales bacterium]|nr:hypothetical protein [Bacteroidales bacterium]